MSPGALFTIAVGILVVIIWALSQNYINPTDDQVDNSKNGMADAYNIGIDTLIPYMQKLSKQESGMLQADWLLYTHFFLLAVTYHLAKLSPTKSNRITQQEIENFLFHASTHIFDLFDLEKGKATEKVKQARFVLVGQILAAYYTNVEYFVKENSQNNDLWYAAIPLADNFKDSVIAPEAHIFFIFEKDTFPQQVADTVLKINKNISQVKA